MRMYHYTTIEAYNEIARTSMFMPSYFSLTLDSTYGPGWYFTTLPPTSSDQVLYTLWNSQEPDRVKRFLEFEIDSSILKLGRPNVYRLPSTSVSGGVINLNHSYGSNGKITIQFVHFGTR